jgi:hypothetical protein
MTRTHDGTFSMNATGGYHKGMSLGVGTYGLRTMSSCWRVISATDREAISACTARYHVFVALGENGVSSLRFIAIEDPHRDRRTSLDKKPLLPAQVQ